MSMNGCMRPLPTLDRDKYLFPHVTLSEEVTHKFYRQLYLKIIRDIALSEEVTYEVYRQLYPNIIRDIALSEEVTYEVYRQLYPNIIRDITYWFGFTEYM